MADDLMTNSKSWFQRTEGKFGTAVTVAMLVAAGGAALFFWGAILPFLITVMSNTLYLIGLSAAVLACLWVVFDPRWRNLAFYGYKSLMRGLTSLFIEIDPIGILKTYISQLQRRLEQMDEGIAKLTGQITKLKLQITKNENDRVHNLELMQEAQKRGSEARNIFVLKGRQAGRLEKSNLTLTDMLKKMESLLKVLQKMRGAASVMVEDIKGEVDVKTQERAMILAGYGAFTAAKKILQGGGDEKELFDDTMAHLADDYGMKLGEIEHFMDVSKGFIDGVDLENGVFETNALKQLEAWEEKSANMLSNPPANGRWRVDGDVKIPALPAPPVVHGSDFSDLFEDPQKQISALNPPKS